MFKKLNASSFSYLIKNGFWLFNSYLINFLVGVGLSWLYANKLAPETFGQYTFLLAILSAFSIFSLPGMGQGLVYALVNKDYGNYKLALKQTFWFSLIGSAILLILSLYYLLQEKNGLGYSLIFLSLIFPL